MIDTTDAILALRTRLLATTVATTGAVSQTATATGYHRASGSYLTEGFRPGMELTLVSGFSTSGNNQAITNTGRIITAVTASDLTCSGTTVEGAATATLTVGIPFLRAWENIALVRVSGSPYIDDDFTASTLEQITAPYDGGLVEETGLYVITLYGLSNYGLGGIRKTMRAIKLRFTPGTYVTAGSDTVRVRGDIGPFESQPLPTGDGWTVLVLTIPWRAHTRNAIAA